MSGWGWFRMEELVQWIDEHPEADAELALSRDDVCFLILELDQASNAKDQLEELRRRKGRALRPSGSGFSVS